MVAKELLRRSIFTLGATAIVVAAQYGAEGEFEEATSTGSDNAPHMTTAGTWGFIVESVSLAKALTCFAACATFGLVWEHVPADMQKQVEGKYNELTRTVTSMAMKNAMVPPNQWCSKISQAFTTVVQPHLDMAWSVADKMVAAPAAKFVAPVVAKFEAKYPEHKGKLPAHLFDLLLVAFFLFYFVVATAWSWMCTVLCCGCCKSKATKAPVELKKKGQAVPSGKKKN